MKKQELFKISDEGAELIRQYMDIFHTDESQFYNPSRKRQRINDTVNKLYTELSDVDNFRSVYSFDEVAALASRVIDQCNEEEPKTRYEKTKHQMLCDIVKKLRPIVTDELMGKNVCVKSGSDDFQYFKVSEVKVDIGMYASLMISYRGMGFEIWPKAFNRGGNSFPTFGAQSHGGVELVLSGKHVDEWLYVLTDDAMKIVFEKAVNGMATMIGIAGY